MKQFDWKYLVLFVLAIPIINQLTGYLVGSVGQHVNEKDASIPPVRTADQDIRVIVSSQDAEGVSQQNVDINFLKNLEAYTVDSIKAKVRELPNSPKIDITSEATYVENGQVKLAVIRLRGSDRSNQVFVLGIMGKELKRVTCVRNSTENISITYGVCAEKIKETFGAKIGA